MPARPVAAFSKNPVVLEITPIPPPPLPLALAFAFASALALAVLSVIPAGNLLLPLPLPVTHRSVIPTGAQRSGGICGYGAVPESNAGPLLLAFAFARPPVL